MRIEEEIKRMLVKINKILSKINNRKGQGIVEYALLLAFVVGIAMMLNGTNLGGAVKGVFDKVVLVLDGGEDDSGTPTERDLRAMKKIGEALANNFTSGQPNASKWNTIQDGKLVLQKNFMVVAMFSDGTMDVYLDGNAAYGKPALWLSTLDKDSEVYKSYANTLQNAGIDLSNPEKLKSTFGVKDTEANWSNGYAVAYDNGSIRYMSLPASMSSSDRSTDIGYDSTGNDIIARKNGVKEITSYVNSN